MSNYRTGNRYRVLRRTANLESNLGRRAEASYRVGRTLPRNRLTESGDRFSRLVPREPIEDSESPRKLCYVSICDSKESLNPINGTVYVPELFGFAYNDPSADLQEVEPPINPGYFSDCSGARYNLFAFVDGLLVTITDVPTGLSTPGDPFLETDRVEYPWRQGHPTELSIRIHGNDSVTYAVRARAHISYERRVYESSINNTDLVVDQNYIEFEVPDPIVPLVPP